RQAVNRATVSVKWTRSLAVWSIVPMAKASGDSRPGVPGILFSGIHIPLKTRGKDRFGPIPSLHSLVSHRNRDGPCALGFFPGSSLDALRAVLQRRQAEQDLSDRGRCLAVRQT